MKAEDLMIGDWVINANIPKQVLGVVGHKVLFLNGKTKMWYPIKACHPIQLTPEILEKNGCKRYDEATRRDGLYKYEVGSSRCIVVFDLNPVRTPFIDCENATCRMQRRIIYVHELQHAIKQCEIEKEIVL